MKVLSGHLTATERNHIKTLLDAGACEGHTKSKRYLIEPLATNKIDVTIWSKGRIFIGDDIRWDKSYATIELN